MYFSLFIIVLAFFQYINGEDPFKDSTGALKGTAPSEDLSFFSTSKDYASVRIRNPFFYAKKICWCIGALTALLQNPNALTLPRKINSIDVSIPIPITPEAFVPGGKINRMLVENAIQGREIPPIMLRGKLSFTDSAFAAALESLSHPMLPGRYRLHAVVKDSEDFYTNLHYLIGGTGVDPEKVNEVMKMLNNMVHQNPSVVSKQITNTLHSRLITLDELSKGISGKIQETRQKCEQWIEENPDKVKKMIVGASRKMIKEVSKKGAPHVKQLFTSVSKKSREAFTDRFRKH